MSRSLLPVVTLAMFGGVVWLGWGSATGEEVDFNRDVRPIFNQHSRWGRRPLSSFHDPQATRPPEHRAAPSGPIRP